MSMVSLLHETEAQPTLYKTHLYNVSDVLMVGVSKIPVAYEELMYSTHSSKYLYNNNADLVTYNNILWDIYF